MSFLRRLLGERDKEKKEKPKDYVIEEDGIAVYQRDPSLKVIESYWIHNPLSKVTIVELPESEGNIKYFVEEVLMNGNERKAYKGLISILNKELKPPESIVTDASTYVLEEAKRVAKKYRRSLGKFSESSWEKIFYYVVRDLAGYGKLHAIMMDPNIEDISCNGLSKPIYVWHRKYESIPTNIEFVNEYAYNNFVIKLAHLSGKHISSAYPMLDAMLPEKHRLAATFMREVSTFGSTFCIRKFRSEPFSIADLIKLGTLDEEIAAYLWFLLENKMNLMVIGGTGAGKTSMLNALTSLLSPNDKIITVEEVAELNPCRENWVQLVSRKSVKFGESDTTSISLFDLVRHTLRYRPDYIIVGEVRGEEAYVLFQAIATGHGGMCTMHADSIDHAVKRLTSPPMNVAEIYIPLMNICIYVSRVELPKRRSGLTFGRRVRNVWEVIDFGKYNAISQWDPVRDRFITDFSKSILLERIASLKGLEMSKILKEIDERKRALRKMVELNMNAREVAQAVVNYSVGKPVEAAKKDEANNSRPKKESRKESSTPQEDQPIEAILNVAANLAESKKT
jgi:flagellar protein FlaI